ncbi:MAG: acetyl-CoA carboxylase carboxyl transferase subunit beta, partial [Gemmatimonadota bacterium]
MSWFRKPEKKLQAGDKRELPGDVWEKCPACSEILYREKVRDNWNVCPSCAYHLRLAAADYLHLLFDDEWAEYDADLRSADPLEFTDLKPYVDRLADAERKTGQSDAVITASGTIDSIAVQAAIMNFAFIGGSMGSVVGEKIARAGLRSLEKREPL